MAINIDLITIIILLAQILFLSSFRKFGKYPTPLPHSDNPRKEYFEVVIYTLFVISYLTLDIFVLRSLFDFLFIVLFFSTIIFLLIPLIYTRFRDYWTKKDFGITTKVKSRWIAVFGIIFYIVFGFYNTQMIEIPWYLLLIYFYSNAFLEEFLFRGVIQSKLERALEQKKAIIFQAFIFMAIHIPVNGFHLLSDGNLSRFFLSFGFQFINGITFGLIFLKTRNIWISVICHYLNNWLGAIITLFL